MVAEMIDAPPEFSTMPGQLAKHFTSTPPGLVKFTVRTVVSEPVKTTLLVFVAIAGANGSNCICAGPPDGLCQNRPVARSKMIRPWWPGGGLATVATGTTPPDAAVQGRTSLMPPVAMEVARAGTVTWASGSEFAGSAGAAGEDAGVPATICTMP